MVKHRRAALAGGLILAVFSLLSTVAANQPLSGLLLNDPGSFDGYTLFKPIQYDTTYLIDIQGEMVHSWDTAPGLFTYLLEDGNLLLAARDFTNEVFPYGGRTGRVERYDWDGNLTWEFEYSTDDFMLHHDIEVLPNGNLLMIAWERKTGAEAIAAGRDPALLRDGDLAPLHLIEVEPTGAVGGTIVWEWHLWDHLTQDHDATKDNFGIVALQPQLVDINFFDSRRSPAGEADWTHANAIDYNEQFDQIVVSVRHLSELWVIDHSTTTAEAAGHSGGNSGMGGDILYRWGNPQAYRAGDAEDQQLYLQHDTRWIEIGLPGAGNLMVLNNGNGRPGGQYSSVEEIEPPVDGSRNYALTVGQAFGPTTPIWTYSAANPPDFFSGFASGAHRLPNGNTFVTSTANGTLFEVTNAKTTVWTYVNPVTVNGPGPIGLAPSGNSVFRAHRYAPDFPGLLGQDLTPGGLVELADSDKDGLSDFDETNVYFTDPQLADTDGDGCKDGAEILLTAAEGGERDPTNQWDFYDVLGPGAELPTDGVIDLPNDILGVILHFSPQGQPPYDVNFDRGPSTGPNPWNMTAPDGVIDLPNDILGVIQQFNHDCR